MNLDHTGIGIVCGVVTAILYAVVEHWRKKDFQVINCVVMFLAVFGVIASVVLIQAALQGDPNKLPSSWREYLAVAGVVSLALASQHIVKKLRELFDK